MVEVKLGRKTLKSLPDTGKIYFTVFLLDKSHKNYQKGLEFTSEDELTGKVLPSLKLKVGELFRD